MKLSEILGWKKKEEQCEIGYIDEGECPGLIPLTDNEKTFNTALTSCDREIDREALEKVIEDYYNKNKLYVTCKGLAQYIISTMPTWLRKVSEK